jgi:hypothetical protein
MHTCKFLLLSFGYTAGGHRIFNSLLGELRYQKVLTKPREPQYQFAWYINPEDHDCEALSLIKVYSIDCLHVSSWEMGGACSTYGGEERCIECFGGDTGGEETTWKTQA